MMVRLFAATSDGPYLSYSWGEHWQALKGGIGKGIGVFYCLGPLVFAGGSDGLFVSDDFGENWKPVELWNGGEVLSLLPSSYFGVEPVIFAGTREGLYRSRDGGESWLRIGEDLISGSVRDLAWPGPSLFAATSHGLFLSDDGGDSWFALTKGLPEIPLSSLVVSNLFSLDPIVIVGSEGAGFFISRDGGETFVATGGLSWAKRDVFDLFWWEASLFAGTDAGLFVSLDAGKNWKSAAESFAGTKVYTISVPAAGSSYQSDILVGTEEGVFKSADGAMSWRRLSEGLSDSRILNLATFPFPRENISARRKR